MTSMPRTTYAEQASTQSSSLTSAFSHNVWSPYVARKVLGRHQLVTTSGHPIRKLGRSSGDIGGDFEVVKQHYSESSGGLPQRIDVHSPFYGRQGTYAWAWKANPSVSDYPANPSSTNATLIVIGAKMISQVLPTNPVSGLAVALGELREGIPSLVGSDFFKSRTALAKSAGSEYLNVQFGWLPLVSDIQKFSHAVKHQDEILAQYVRNSGKRVKRTASWPVERSSTTSVSTGKYSVPGLPSYLYHSPGTLTTTTTTTRRIWFSGCFTYYLAPQPRVGKSKKRNEQLRNKLYGTRITPNVLWQLAPWSWAADWVGNTGDVLHNVSAFANDGLVMPYAYVMEEASTTQQHTLTDIRYRDYHSPGGVTQPVTLTQTFTTTSKKRVGASPFGFGLNPSSFTGRQGAILGALGLSKL